MIYLTEYDPAGGLQDRETEHRLGRELLQFALARDYGGPYQVVQKGYGKPYLEGTDGIDFSISHTEGLVVCGVSGRRIGVDVEHIRSFDERLMERICMEEEIAYIMAGKEEPGTREEKFFRLWTLKESFLKATGQGLSRPMRDAAFFIRAGENRRQDIMGTVSGWDFSQFRYRDRFIISICEEETNNDL